MDENNKALEDAANALNEAAEANEAPATPAEAPIEAQAADVKVEETPVEAPVENAASEMTEEPKVEMPVAESAPVIEAPAAPAPTPVAETPKKKKKTGLIIGCALGGAAVLGLGGLGVAYAISNTTDNIALAAISDFLSTTERAVDGYIDISMPEEDDSDKYYIKAPEETVSHVRVDIATENDKDHNANTSVTFTATYGKKDYTITLKSVVLKDYTLYISIENLKETIKDVLEVAGDTDYADYAELYEDLIDQVVGEIDGVWWKIYIPDVVDSIDELSSSNKKMAKGAYECVVDAADRAFAKQDKYGDIYKKNAFVTLEEYKGGDKPSAKGTPYKVKLDASKLTSFVNTVSEDAIDEEFNDCMKNVSSSYSNANEKVELKEEDVKEALANFPDFIVTIDNGFFSHTVTGLYLSSSENVEAKIDIKFSKDVKSVSAPSDAKDITELYDNVKKAYEDWQETATCKAMKLQYPTYYNTYCDAKTNKPKPEYQNLLKNNTNTLVM